MAKSTKKKPTQSKTASKKKARKKPLSKKTPSSKKAWSDISNREAYWAAYRHLQKQVDTAWKKLQASVKKSSSPQMIHQAKSELMLLLGECNYMARECMRMAQKNRRRK